MIVWGGVGTNVTTLDNGGLYDPAANSWTVMTTTGAPAGRRDHTAVWTGSEMIVWGGTDGAAALFNDTFTYIPDAGAGFQITSVVANGENLVISFPTVINRVYTLWRSDNLAGATWTDTGLPALVGTGATLTFTIPATTPPSGFFRVQAGP
jgi:hypothetical protein